MYYVVFFVGGGGSSFLEGLLLTYDPHTKENSGIMNANCFDQDESGIWPRSI